MTAQPFGSIYDKRKPRDPLSRMIIQNFLGSVRGLIRGLEAQSILDVGCGDGWLTAHLLEARPQASVIAVDVSTALVDLVGILPPAVKVVVAAGEHLPFDRDAFDVVVASEVLEHLPQPDASIREISRVTRRYALLTVPFEPFWSLGNILCGRHLRTLGNTPGHLHRWSRRTFRRLLDREFVRITSRVAFPWIVVLAAKRRESNR